MRSDEFSGTQTYDALMGSRFAGERLEWSRRRFLGSLGGAAALGTLGLCAPFRLVGAPRPPAAALDPVLRAKPLRVQPVLVYSLPQRQELTSWRSYGGLQKPADVDQEVARIDDELRRLTRQQAPALEFAPLLRISSDAELAAARARDTDAYLVYAASGAQSWLETLAASGRPNVMFLRHRSGPLYLWYEIAHWRFLRKSEDVMREPNMDVDDIVVDDYADVAWRLHALYGLKNTLGTKVLALGGLEPYSRPSEVLGYDHAEKVWKFEIKQVPNTQLEPRIQQARADAGRVKDAERRTKELLSQRNVKLGTSRESVVDTFIAAAVIKEMMQEHGTTNLGVARCMGGLIPILRTPPCLVLSLLNDEGYTAFCHVDMTHTMPGVLLHHISGKPSFVANTHYPHHGLLTLAHCAAPRKMNGKDTEPTQLLTHFESDCGAATKVQYRKGQIVTTLVPHLNCTKWIGFRARIEDSPAFDACRSQMDLRIEGDWRRLLRDMQGFHAIVCYDDYLREVGYALKRVGVAWDNLSATADARPAV